MSNRITLIIGVAAGVLLVLAINAFAHRAHEPRMGGQVTATLRGFSSRQELGRRPIH